MPADGRNLPEKQAESSDHEPQTHKGEGGPDPSEQRSLVGEVLANSSVLAAGLRLCVGLILFHQLLTRYTRTTTPAPAVKSDRPMFHETEGAKCAASIAFRFRIKLAPAITMTNHPAIAARTPRYRFGRLSITWNFATP